PRWPNKRFRVWGELDFQSRRPLQDTTSSSMMNASGLATALLTLLVPGVLLQCQPRDYGKGSVVCVCDTTQCDFIGVVRPEQPGVIAVYESGKAGKRFDKTTLSFNEPGEPGRCKSRKSSIKNA
ncbi:unnamed protein product, partial [Ixodes pacificus]